MRARPDALDGLTRLRDEGVTLALDDFGTGPASLTNLCHIPIDALKIDRALTSRLGSRHESALVEAVTALCGRLGVDVVAEAIETQAQLDELRRVHCPHAQGNLFAPALRAEDATRLVQNGTSEGAASWSA